MAFHDLKIWPEFFGDVVRGIKTAELRKNDRDYKIGDVLNLREYDQVTEQYTGLSIRARVTHVQRIADLDPALKNTLGLNPCLAPINQLVVLSIVVTDA